MPVPTKLQRRIVEETCLVRRFSTVHTPNRSAFPPDNSSAPAYASFLVTVFDEATTTPTTITARFTTACQGAACPNMKRSQEMGVAVSSPIPVAMSRGDRIGRDPYSMIVKTNLYIDVK